MLPDLMLETLPWCSRDDLDSIQLTSRLLRQLIESRSGSLPLRTLERVDMAYSQGDTFQIETVVDDFPVLRYGYPVGYFRTSMSDAGDMDAILQRLQNAIVKKFYFDIVHTAFLAHFIESAPRLGIVVERTEFRMPASPTNDDFARVGTIVNLLRPLAYNVSEARRLRCGLSGLYLNETAY